MAITRCFLINQGILYFRVNNNSQTAYRVVTHKRYIDIISSNLQTVYLYYELSLTNGILV